MMPNWRVGALVINMFAKCAFIIISLLLCLSSAHAYDDPRYCGEPKRNAANKIIRSIAERERFEALWPLLPGMNRSDWQVDHVIPLKNGGCDLIVNMQWLPNKTKTCSDDSCKDRWERKLYKKTSN